MVCAGRKKLMARSRAGGHVDRGGIADHQRAGRDGDRGASAEGEAGGGDEIDGAAALADADVGRADGERVGAELVGEDDADLRAADGDVHDLAQGGVGRAVDESGGRARAALGAAGAWRGLQRRGGVGVCVEARRGRGRVGAEARPRAARRQPGRGRPVVGGHGRGGPGANPVVGRRAARRARSAVAARASRRKRLGRKVAARVCWSRRVVNLGRKVSAAPYYAGFAVAR